jgi:hypothetical protein
MFGWAANRFRIAVEIMATWQGRSYLFVSFCFTIDVEITAR